MPVNASLSNHASAQNADWFRLIFEHSADAMALIDPCTHTYLALNQTAASHLTRDGHTDQLEGSRFLATAPELQPDGRPSLVVFDEVIKCCSAQGSHRFQWTHRRTNGEPALFDVVATWLVHQDQPVLLTSSRLVEAQQPARPQSEDSPQRWKSFFDQSPISMQVFGPDGSTRAVNAAFNQLFHQLLPDLEQFNIRKDAQLAAAGFSEDIERAFAGTAVTLPAIPFEMKIIPGSASKGVRWIGSILFPVFDDQGQVSEVVCIHKDETTQKMAEAEVQFLTHSLEQTITERSQELRLTQNRFQELFEQSPLGMARVNWSGKFLQVNHAFASMLGYEPEQVPELSYWDITPVEYHEQELKILESVQDHGRFGPYEKEYIHRDGHRIPIVLNGVLIRTPDGGDEMWGITEDVTDKRRAEQALRASEKKYRALFETSSQGVMLHDKDHLFAEVNPAAARIFGLTPEQLIGRHPASMAPEFQADGTRSDLAARQHIRRCLEHGTSRFEWTHLHSKGYEMMMEVVLSRVSDGQCNLIQAVVTDISERKQAEAELKRALERERELNQLKSDFVSMVSHEFRTPLGIIQSSAEILDDYIDQLEPEERGDQLQSIIKNSRRMATLMEDVLLLGQLDADRLEFAPSPLDLAALCRRLVEEVQFATEAKCPIKFSTTTLPDVANADERLLRHALLNLLTNAVKYSDPGQQVTFHASASHDGLRFIVQDQGIGIPEDEQASLFEAFHRGSNVGQRPGTGLGLVIVKRSTELHGGTIHLNSKPGTGTTFTIDIPLNPS
jgi:PAS domain S-box-containing protein